MAAILALELAGCGGSSEPAGASLAGTTLGPALPPAPGGFGYVDAFGKEARFMFLSGIVLDKAGNAFVADGQVIRKITPDGAVTTFAGAPQGDIILDPPWRGFWKAMPSVDANGRDARFQPIKSIAIDILDNLYVTEFAVEHVGIFYVTKGAVRRITPDGSVTTPVRGGVPYGIAVAPTGTVYFSDIALKAIKKMTPGSVTVHAGAEGVSGAADGIGNVATFAGPAGLAVDNAGNVYATDFLPSYPNVIGTSNHTIRRIGADGVVTTIAGSPGMAGSADGKGSSARFRNPNGIWVDAMGVIYVADTDNGTIRRISADGTVTTVAGKPGEYGSADGAGTQARFQSPVAITGDNLGNLFVGDRGNFTVRKISATGNVTTIAGAPRDQ